MSEEKDQVKSTNESEFDKDTDSQKSTLEPDSPETEDTGEFLDQSVLEPDSPETEDAGEFLDQSALELDSLETEDVDEEESMTDKIKNSLLWLVLVLVILGFIALFYRFFPLTSKINGTWKAETVNGNYRIENDSGQSTFIMENMNNTTGMNLVFQSEIIPEAENEYFVKNTQIFLELNREYFDDNTINQIIGDGSSLETAMSTNSNVRLKYTKKGIKQMFPDEDINKLFKYVLKDFNWKLQGETLRLRNGSFAEGGISFKKE